MSAVTTKRLIRKAKAAFKMEDVISGVLLKQSFKLSFPPVFPAALKTILNFPSPSIPVPVQTENQAK